MLFPVKQLLMQKYVSTIIAPHGITDIMHANEYGLMRRVYEIYASAVIGTHFLHVGHYEPIINAVFIVCSIAHFRHDMPVVEKVPRYVLSTSLIPMFAICNPTFYAYMIFIHVPNHYYMNWRYIEPKLVFNLGVLFAFTLLLSFGWDIFFQRFVTDYFIDIMKSVVIAHIVYEESYIHKKDPLREITDKPPEDI